MLFCGADLRRLSENVSHARGMASRSRHSLRSAAVRTTTLGPASPIILECGPGLMLVSKSRLQRVLQPDVHSKACAASRTRCARYSRATSAVWPWMATRTCVSATVSNATRSRKSRAASSCAVSRRAQVHRVGCHWPCPIPRQDTRSWTPCCAHSQACTR